MAKINSLKKKRSTFDSVIINAKKAHEKSKLEKHKLEQSKSKHKLKSNTTAKSTSKSKTKKYKKGIEINISEKYPDMIIVNDWEELVPNDYVRYINSRGQMKAGYINAVSIEGNSYIVAMRKRKSSNASNQFKWEINENTTKDLYKSKIKTQMSAQISSMPQSHHQQPIHHPIQQQFTSTVIPLQSPEYVSQLERRVNELEILTKNLILKIDEIILSTRHLHDKNSKFEKTLVGIIKHINLSRSR